MRSAQYSSQDGLFPGPVDVSLGFLVCLPAFFLSLFGGVVGQAQVVLIHGERLVPLLLLGGAEHAEHRVPKHKEPGGCHEHSAPVFQRRLPEEMEIVSVMHMKGLVGGRRTRTTRVERRSRGHAFDGRTKHDTGRLQST